MKKFLQKLVVILFVGVFAVGTFAQTTPTIAEGEQAVFFENTENWTEDVNVYILGEDASVLWTELWPGDKCTYLGDNIWKWTYSGGMNIYGETTVYGWMFFNTLNNRNNSSKYLQTNCFKFVNGGYYNANGYVKTITPSGEEVFDPTAIQQPKAFVDGMFSDWDRDTMMLSDSIFSIEYENMFAGTYNFRVSYGNFNVDGIMFGGDNVVNSLESNIALEYSNGSISFTLTEYANVRISYNVECNKIYLYAEAVEVSDEYVTEFTICSGDCFMWNGDTYCEAGVYAKTITSEVTGHISVVAALKLNVVESSRHIEYVNICYGDTYNFRGKYISQTGVYSDTLVSNTGCDSIVELHLTVLPNYEQTFNATIKEGEVYSGHGFNGLTQPGTYSLPLVSLSTGCDSTVILNLTVVAAEEESGMTATWSIEDGAVLESFVDVTVSFAGVDSVGRKLDGVEVTGAIAQGSSTNALFYSVAEDGTRTPVVGGKGLMYAARITENGVVSIKYSVANKGYDLVDGAFVASGRYCIVIDAGDVLFIPNRSGLPKVYNDKEFVINFSIKNGYEETIEPVEVDAMFEATPVNNSYVSSISEVVVTFVTKESVAINDLGEMPDPSVWPFLNQEMSSDEYGIGGSMSVAKAPMYCEVVENIPNAIRFYIASDFVDGITSISEEGSYTLTIPAGVVKFSETEVNKAITLNYTIGALELGYKISYVLNGGVTNPWGWQNKQDMYETLNADWNAHSGTSTKWKTLEELDGNIAAGIPTQAGSMSLTFLENESFKLHFSWLIEYMDATCAAQGQTLPSTNAAFLRYNLAAFFLNTQRASWPRSADYALAGDISYFQKTWQAGFDNPNVYVEGDYIVLNTPYREGYSFTGWYTDEALTEKVTVISGIDKDITLYAGWTEYIPTIGEVIAMEDGTATKAQGAVTYTAGSNFWIQDATGGILCYGKNNGVKEGDYVVLSGEKTIYQNSPELNSAVVVLREEGEEIAPQKILLSDIIFDSVNNYTTYLNELVYIEGVVISKYEDNGTYKTPYVTDGINEIALYKWDGITEDVYPVGTKVSVKAVLAIYRATLQLRGKGEWITPAAAVGKDSYEYEKVRVGGVNYAFENNWIYSETLGNWADNRPNPIAEGSRSIVEKDGILYFPYRNNNTPTEQPKLVRVDAKTGKMLSPVLFADYIFKDTYGKWIFAPYTDLKLDNAGNAITSNLVTYGEVFQIWNVDLETGEGRLIIDLATDSMNRLGMQFPNTSIRLDRIGVYGDINGDATIMSVISGNSDNAVLSWNIVDGKWDGKTNWISLDILWSSLSGAPTVTPVKDGYFYVDALETYPFLFDPYGNKDGFTSEAGADHLTIGSKGVSRSKGHNGVTEFEFNGEKFLLIAGDNTVGNGTAPSTFVLYKFADENREFNKMTQMWEFPMDGMGSNSNVQRTASSFVRLSEDGSKVDIYVYTLENGYGHYTMSIAESGDGSNFKLHLRDGEQAVFFENADLEGNTVWDGNINAYAWTYNDYYELEEYTNSWPGDPCLYVGNNIWKWTYEGSENISGNIIFNNSNYQTYDLNYVNGGLYNSANYQSKVKPIGIDKVSAWIGTWNSRGGEVYGSGVYNVGDTIIAKAEANKGYVFTKWSDGSVENPRILIAGEDTTLVAYFDMEYLVIHVEIPGTLGEEALELVDNLSDILAVKITGTLNDEDVNIIRTRMTNLKQLDISELNMQYLPDYMFEYSQIEKVVLPKGLIGIGRNAFYNCSNLTYVDMPDSLQTIGYAAFYYCTKLASVDLANTIITIDSYAFAGTALTTVVFPESLTALGSYAFSNCSRLTSVTTNSQLVNINSRAFDECIRLKTVNLAEGLRYINQYAFANCDALSAIKFPSTLVSIDSYAFQYCAQLASVEFNEGLEEINNNAFRYCHSLRDAIYLPSSLVACKTSFGDYVQTIYSYAAIPPTMGNGYIYYCDTLYVPAMSLNQYKLASGYEVFQHILPMEDILPEIITIHENTTLTVPDSLPADYKPMIKMTNSRGDDYFMPSLVLRGDSVMSLSYFDLWYDFVSDYYNNNWGSYNEYNLQKVPYYNSFVCNAPVRADQVAINMFMYDNVWNFVSLPFDVKVSDILLTANSMFVVRKYSGADRAATNFDATWQNMTKDSVLRAGEGYIWQSSHPENVYTQFKVYAQDNVNKNNIFATTDRSVKLNEYLSEFEHNRSWNLIGNPYPTFFDIQSTDFTAPITVWNMYNQTYEAYSPIDDYYVLTPGEAFFVQKPIDVDAITFYADGRMTNTQVEALANTYSSSMARVRAHSSSYREIFNLELLEDGNSKDKTRFVLNEEASVNYEINCDASKFVTKGNDVAQIYTRKDDVDYAINERPMDNGIVNLVFETSKAGEYTIAMTTNSTRQAILVDKVLNKEVVLNYSGYTFEAEAGVVADRFYIVFSSGVATDLNNDGVMLVDVYSREGEIVVEASKEAQIKVYSVSGIVVAETTADKASFNVESGVYVVAVDNNLYKVAITK